MSNPEDIPANRIITRLNGYRKYRRYRKQYQADGGMFNYNSPDDFFEQLSDRVPTESDAPNQSNHDAGLKPLESFWTSNLTLKERKILTGTIVAATAITFGLGSSFLHGRSMSDTGLAQKLAAIAAGCPAKGKTILPVTVPIAEPVTFESLALAAQHDFHSPCTLASFSARIALMNQGTSNGLLPEPDFSVNAIQTDGEGSFLIIGPPPGKS